jgi:predicted dehydrogenase
MKHIPSKTPPIERDDGVGWFYNITRAHKHQEADWEVVGSHGSLDLAFAFAEQEQAQETDANYEYTVHNPFGHRMRRNP